MHDYPAITDDAKVSLTEVYAQAMIYGGVENAATCFNALKDDTTHYYFSEQEMNRLGYEFLYFSIFKDCKTYALETFKINTLLFPRNYNAYDSYAEALADAGRKRETLLMYQKSLDLNPGNKEGRMAMERIMAQLK